MINLRDDHGAPKKCCEVNKQDTEIKVNRGSEGRVQRKSKRAQC